MTYHSTRDSKACYTASQAITQGLSIEGGLIVPEEIPSITSNEIRMLVKINYASRASYILSKYLTDFSIDEIDESTGLAYNAKRFRSPAVAPLHELYEGVNLLELWHGPTCAFKDMALQILPHLMYYSARRTAENKTIVILVATSGDTGKAALEGFRDAENTRIIVFYPENGVSPMQKLQMITQEGGNVAVCGIEGNFDDAQTGVKKIFNDPGMVSRLDVKNMMFSSANSINLGRLLPQIVYYISAYCDMIGNGRINADDLINVVVPTGNFGNILAAYYARKMGLPIAKLICASNRNRVLTDFLNTGEYNRNRSFYTTTSPSMDILISSNLERLLYDISENNDVEIIYLMKQLRKKGRYTVSDKIAKDIKSIFWAGWCDDEQTAQTIKNVYENHDYLCDTHTAVAVNVYEQYRKSTGDKTPTVIVSTANPYKFSASVLDALGGNCSDGNEFELMDRLHELTRKEIPEPLKSIREKEKRFTDVCKPKKMKKTVYKLLGIKK
ncbi:MAG: threonine synthase [Oscillospiraceae bacterium]|nr:threonine synthase [Oscillospiraceae bacterium]